MVQCQFPVLILGFLLPGAEREDVDLPMITDPTFIQTVTNQLDGKSRKWELQV